MKNPKIIFMGTPEFAVPAMQALQSVYGLAAVVTVPDKAQGRGLKMMPSAVKAAALEFNVPILQPESLKSEEFAKEIAEINPDIICVIAFKILPFQVYSLAKIAAFNIHGSLLPKYRGAAPINRAIMNGEKQSGLTSFILQKEVDKGNILLKEHVEIAEDESAGELHEKLMPLAAELTLKTCKLLVEGNYNALAQNDDEATAAPKIFKDDCRIDWNKDAQTIKNQIRGLSPYPSAFCSFQQKSMKIHKVTISDTRLETGTYLISHNAFLIGCADKAIEILELQPESKKAMKVKDFLNGYKGEKEGKME